MKLGYMKKSIKLPQVIRFWGVCDIACIALYFFGSILRANVPFYHDVSQAIHISDSLGFSLPIINVCLGIVLYVSMAFSGVFLYQLRKEAATICYIQIPFRLYLARPSLYFIFWPLKYIEPSVTLGIVLFAISELLKLVSIIYWHLNKNH